MHNQPEIAVVILNWNGINHLQKFLPSVVLNSQEANIYVIDNASTDDSVSFLQNNYPKIQLIIHSTNLGFCEGYNVGLQEIKADYLILLNNDVEVTPNWLSAPISYMQMHANVAVCQPKILSYSEKSKFEYAGAAGGFLDMFGYPFCRGRIFNTIEIDNGQYNNIESITWATGAAFFIRSQIFIELQGFDANFFAHMEEIDLCCRVIRNGYDVKYIPQSVVYHLGAGTLTKNSAKKTFLNYRNGLLLIHKNYAGIFFPIVLFIRLIFDGISGLRFLLGGDFANFYAIIRAHFGYYNLIFKTNRPTTSTSFNKMIFKNYSIVFLYFIFFKRKFSNF
ncbi:MAG: glycosyltransferase family 2 protein [Bacteroidota bacterium]|nr:glycosyltransferase family 2 protein [Bacteroidota bacterium]